MTQASITAFGFIALAMLGVIALLVKQGLKDIAAGLDAVHTQIMPAWKSVADDLYQLKLGHALNQQEIEQNAARLNRQGQTLNTVLLTTAPVPAAPAPVPAPAPTMAPPVPTAAPPTTPAVAADAPTPGIVGTLLSAVGLTHKDPEPEAAPAPTAEQTPPPPASVSVTPSVNISVMADRALSAAELAAAHAQLDAQNLDAQNAGAA